MRRTKLGLLTALTAATMLSVAPVAAAAPAASPAIACETVYWGSLAKTSTSSTTSSMTNIRTGRHTCFDRMVLDLSGTPAGYSVKYVSALTGIGSGQEVSTTGGARLEILLKAGASPSYNPGATVKTLNYQTFRQQVWLGSFEGQTKVGISTRARLPMRAFVLSAPDQGSRLVIDVAHYWY
ncbi:hypothetical protein CIK76_02445 [Glutamicibacter sp. BW80]|uniref:AMIN-like domain-containing (lipo)protein n=1 Tax=unclassified Glutamicibacter TaxID=2627139 RepID=UPI000BB87090|nr:hypothetical protein [Glutamicibacter sp. BW80]PCC29980.1 hypothetical protein CIK76_02445 [Glutamicibacter sp. BW80]